MTELESQLRESVFIVQENNRLRRLIDVLQAENAALREGYRREFDSTSNDLPALLRRQAE